MSSNTKAFEDKMKSAVEHLERELKTVRAADHPGVTLQAGSGMLVDARAVGPLRDSGQALLQGSEGAQLRVGLTPLGRPKVCAPGGAVPGYPNC